jgi:phage baseplate assembly protein W
LPRFPNRLRYELNQLPSKPTTILPIGVSIPFNNPNGVFYQTFTNLDQVRTNLRNLLLTAKGERYMLPDFGTDIRWLLFENISDESEFRTKLSAAIIEPVDRWMPYLTLNDVDVKFNLYDDGRVTDPENAVSISFTANILGTPTYFPMQILISEEGNLQVIEAIYNE